MKPKWKLALIVIPAGLAGFHMAMVGDPFSITSAAGAMLLLFAGIEFGKLAARAR